jgi:predicted DNA-binding transcriptional regulator YafY
VRRKSRLFAIAEYLRGRRTGVTAQELAERFDVGIRTIYRDLDSLRDASLPLNADRGRGGGYALDRAYTLPPINFSPREAAILVALGRFVTEMRLLPFAETLGTALDKVRGALSQSAQRELLEHTASLQFIGVPAPAVSPEIRRAVETAWFEQRPLRIRYRAPDGITTTSRLVKIRSAVLERASTLLNCDDLDKGEPRQFRLDRIETAQLVAS